MSLWMLAAETRTYFRFARTDLLTEWWQWLLVVLVCVLVGAYVLFMYLRDTVELPRGWSVILITLRLLALAAVLFYFLDLEKGSERRVTKNSRIVMLLDTSQSMGLSDPDSGPRIDQVIETMAGPDLMPSLLDKHDVVVYRFDEQAEPTQIAAFSRLGDVESMSLEETIDAGKRDLEVASRTAWIGVAVLGLAVVCGLGALAWPRSWSGPEATAWPVLGAILSLFFGLTILAVAQLRFADFGLPTQLGLAEVDWESWSKAQAPSEQSLDEPPPVNWVEQLEPNGRETHLGDAVRWVVAKERGGPIAGVVVVTDGRSNSGADWELAVIEAQDARVNLYPVGLGAERRPPNVQVADIEAPQRVYPGDDFEIKGFVQSFGWEGRAVRVQLLAGPEPLAGQQPPPPALLEERTLSLGEDGQTLAVLFKTQPSEEGRRRYTIRVAAPAGDFRDNDNERSAVVEVADTQNRVLLLAGGPTREYRFVRSVAYRDADVHSTVLLQSGETGLAQEADEILFEFPRLADELFEYDCIVAFDPDWEALDDQQAELLERWVSEKAGGLITVAGPVFTPEWSRSRRGASRKLDLIRALYPVVFLREGSVSLSTGKVGGDQPWPLRFSRDGQEARFLWLEDDALASEAAWAQFDGVYGYFAVRDRKEGARVYARFSDPSEVSLDNESPIYMAGQYYGAGRVFFLASGEMWRLRGVDDSYLSRYYTQLIRWASEGRLLRDSNRGVLLVDKERCYLRDQVSITAILTDAQHRPLQADEVVASLTDPNGERRELTLGVVKDAARAGTFVGFFTATAEGDYRVELAPPDARAGELLQREVRARAPALETDQSTRNDAMLTEMAEQTGGRYYVGMNQLTAAGDSNLASVIPPRQQVAVLPGSVDMDWKQQLLAWLMGCICGALCLEWIIRRLRKLA